MNAKTPDESEAPAWMAGFLAESADAQEFRIRLHACVTGLTAKQNTQLLRVSGLDRAGVWRMKTGTIKAFEPRVETVERMLRYFAPELRLTVVPVAVADAQRLAAATQQNSNLAVAENQAAA